LTVRVDTHSRTDKIIIVDPSLTPDTQSKEWFLGIVAAVPAAFVLVQKLWRGWASDRKDRTIDTAQADVVEGLMKELQRMRDQNSALAMELDKAQILAARMAGELRRMTAEVTELESQIKRLISRNNEV